MKKVTLVDQLDLSKEVIANLNPEQLQQIEGGAAEIEGSQYSCIHLTCNGFTRTRPPEE